MVTIATDDYVLLCLTPEIKDAVADLMTRRVVALDFETTGLDPRRDVPLLCGVDEYIFPGWAWAIELLRPLAESKDTVKVEYNATFEGMIFEAHGIRQRRVVDPMLGDQLLYNGKSHRPTGFFTLGQALERYLYIKHDKALQTSFVGADVATFVPTDEQCRYLRRDTLYLPQLSEAVARKVAAEGMMPTWKLENQYSQAIAMMQYHGVLVDVEGYRAELEKVNAEFDELERQVSEVLTPSILEVRRRRYQAALAIENDWKAEYQAYKDGLEEKWQPGHFTSKQSRRDFLLEKHREWKANHPKPPQARMNHGPIVVTSPEQIHSALNEMGIQVEDTEKETLILARAGRPADQVELLRLLGELSVVKKIRANEGPELLTRLQDGNRLTTRYHQLQARTGRISSSKWRDKGRCDGCYAQLVHAELELEEGEPITCPQCGRSAAPKNFGKQWGANMQNLTPRIKRYVKPGPGRKFVIYDYSQIEMRVMAEMILQENPAATDAIVKAFRDGLDPHSLMGEDVTGIPYADFYDRAVVKKEPDMVRLRRGMKVINFGAGFGFGAPAMAVKIYVDVEDDTPFGNEHIAAAQDRLDAFWRVNPTLAVLRDRIGASAISDGFTETMGGRRRYYETKGIPRWQLNGIRRQAVSTKIQGTAADIAKEAQNLIYDALADNDPSAWLWAPTHDEIAMECEEEYAEEWNDIMPELMKQAFAKYITHVPCEVDGGIQDAWQH